MFGIQSFGKQMMRVASRNMTMQSNKYSYSQSLSLSWSNMEINSLISRAAPVPSLGLMNIINLRQLIQRSIEQSELQSPLSINLCDIVAKVIVGINLGAVMKNLSTIITRVTSTH